MFKHANGGENRDGWLAKSINNVLIIQEYANSYRIMRYTDIHPRAQEHVNIVWWENYWVNDIFPHEMWKPSIFVLVL